MTRRILPWLAVLAMAGITYLAGGITAPAGTAHVYTLRYVDHTTFCNAYPLGARGLVYGDGPRPFKVVCDNFGDGRRAWDARPWQ